MPPTPTNRPESRFVMPTAAEQALRDLKARLVQWQERLQSEFEAMLADVDEALGEVRSGQAPAAGEPASPAIPDQAPPAENRYEQADVPLAMEQTQIIIMPEIREDAAARTPAPAVTPITRSLTMPPAADQAKTAVYALHQSVENLMANPTIPETDIEIDSDLLSFVLTHSQQLIQRFLQLHNGAKGRAAMRWQHLNTTGGDTANPLNYWHARDLQAYQDFCTTTFVTHFLDPVEATLKEKYGHEYDALLDYLADAMGIERVRIQIGLTRFDRRVHELAAGQGAKSTDGAFIDEVTASGYIHRRHNAVIRKASVRVHAARSEPSGGSDQMAYVSGAPDELPMPELVVKCRRRVARLQAAVSRVVNSGQMPRTGDRLDPAVSALISEYGNWLVESFKTMHTDCFKAAKARYQQLPKDDPNQAVASAWHNQLLARYERFVTKNCMEGFLDRLEAKIRAARLDNHAELVPMFAREMDLGRLHIEPRLTQYDPERHTLQGEVHVTWREELLRARVWEEIRPGYTDLTTGSLVRKALVKVRLPKRPFNPNAQTEADGSYAVDLDLT